MGNNCPWIIFISNCTKNVLLFECIFLVKFLVLLPLLFPCEATAAFVLLPTTTHTVIISITEFLPKPKHSQTPSEQALRDSSKLEVSQEGLCFQFSYSLGQCSKAGKRGKVLGAEELCDQNYSGNCTNLPRAFEKAETAPSSPSIILHLQMV